MPIITQLPELLVGDSLCVENYPPNTYFIGRIARHSGTTEMSSIDEFPGAVMLTRIDDEFYEVIWRNSPADVVIEAIPVQDLILGKKELDAPRDVNIFQRDTQVEEVRFFRSIEEFGGQGLVREVAPVNVGIVGSRRRSDRDSVEKLIDSLDINDTIVSGGCEGVDAWAEAAARRRGMKVLIFKPDLKAIRSRGDMISRYYARNRLIAINSQVLYAFVADDRKGGTENTITHALAHGIKVELR